MSHNKNEKKSHVFLEIYLDYVKKFHLLFFGGHEENKKKLTGDSFGKSTEL